MLTTQQNLSDRSESNDPRPQLSVTESSDRSNQLILGLSSIPENWALTPVNGNKQPYRKNWQNEKPLSRELITGEINSGKAKGYGLRTGKVSGGIIAIDADGHAAHDKINELSGGVPLPETVAFTSNKPGRCQYLFYVPTEYWDAIATKKISTGIKGDDGKDQKLELRWDGCQSVLPPSAHPETGCYRWRRSPEEVAIAPAPKWVIEQMLKESGEASTPSLNRQPYTQEHWTDIQWALSYLNALSPSRADDYDNWLMVGMALHSLNDDSLLMEWDDWSKLSPKYKVGQCQKKWKTFKRSGVAIGTLAHMAKQDGWRTPFDKPTGKSFSGGIGSGGGNRRGNGGSNGSSGDGGDGDGGEPTGKVARFPSFELLTLEQVTEKIDELITLGATGSYLTGQLNGLAAASQFYVGELRKLYYERLGEVELNSERDTNRDEVDNLLKITDQTLDLADYLPEALANPLTDWCNWLSIRPAVALTALLAGMSSLHKVGTELVIHRNKHFEVPPTLYSALVAESGQLKSPVFSNIIRQPLNQLRREKVEAYQAAMEDYEAAMEAWEQSEEKGKKPKKPADPTLYFFTNATGEAIPVQASKVPDKALLASIDELAGLFKSENAHRGGRGSDKQDLLSYFDGTGQTVLRASGVKVDVERIYLSIFGTIQPEVLKGHMSDCLDPDGQWARFLFVNQPLAFAPLGDDDGQAVSIRERIADFYRQIERIPEMEYRLSRAAFKRYQPMHDHLERLRVTHSQPGMRAVYSKMKGIIGRLALNLHVLWEIDAGKVCPSEEIPKNIMDMAIALAKFYIGQVKLIHADSDDESLPRHIAKLIELSKRLEANGKDGWIKAQQYREQFQPKKRPSAQQARDWMKEAVIQGHGRTRGTGNRLEYHWHSDNNCDNNPPPSPDNLGMLGMVRDDLGMIHPEVETIDNKGLEDNLGMLGMGIPNLSGEEASSLNTGEEGLEPSLEGGYIPEPSRSSPQESCDVELVDDTDLGNNLGMPIPNHPEVPEVCDSSVQTGTHQRQERNLLSERTDKELHSLGWSVTQIRDYLVANYKKKSRKYLSDAELQDFVSYLEAQSSPEVTEATPEPNRRAQEVSIEESENLPQFRSGERVQFTNPDSLASLKHLEGVELEVVQINALVAECRLPNGVHDTFAPHTLRKIVNSST
jgi:hypothetical protein